MRYFLLILIILFFKNTLLLKAQVPDTDIFLIPIQTESNGKWTFGTPKNTTKRAGYDNQPSFTPDSKTILYTSIQADGQADIYQYDIATAQHKRITATSLTNEYSPTLLPDGKHISVVQVEKDKHTQRLWKFALKGGKPTLIQEKVKKVGYYCWTDAQNLAMFIVGDDKVPHSLHLAGVKDTASYWVAGHIGRTVRKIPHENAVSFIQKLPSGKWAIKKLDLDNLDTQTIIATLPESEDYAWSADGALLMGKAGKLYHFYPNKDKEWQLIADFSLSEIKDFYRLDISPDGKWLAVVAYRGEKP